MNKPVAEREFCPKYYIRLLETVYGYSHERAVVEGLLVKEEYAKLTTKARKNIPKGQFAKPETRSLPIHDAAHVRNALARMNQVTGGCGEDCKDRICRAAKKFGIESSVCGTGDKKEDKAAEVTIESHEFTPERFERCLAKFKLTGKSPETASIMCRSMLDASP